MESNAEKLVRLAPKLTESERKRINDRFQAYIFRRSKTGEVWTTCCGVYKKLDDNNVTDRELTLLTAPHAPAPDVRWGKDKNAPNSQARVECPWCGAQAAVKEIQYTGGRKNLWEFRRVLALRQWRGALWACAYDCTKDYGCVERSTEGPDIKLLRIYRFRPGKAEEIVREGKLLHHCVGGYADRHISGATTILFLRRRSAPGKPLCTIEMHGKNIRQIHGWDDERTYCEDNPRREDPRKIYGAFLDEWLAWLEGGSKRDKTGRPIIKKKVRKTA